MPNVIALLRRHGLFLLLLLLPLAVLWRPLLLGETLYYQDLAAQYFPREALLRRTGLAGWDPHILLGIGMAGEPQSAAYEPVRAFARATGLSDSIGLVLYLAVYLTIAAFGFYAFALRQGASSLGASATVLVGLWSGLYLVRFRHPWFFPFMALVPAIALLTDRLLARERTLADALAIAILISWAALGGHPQGPYMAWLLVGGYLGAGLVFAIPSGQRSAALFALSWRLAVAAVAFLGLIAIYYAPVVHLLSHASRATQTGLRFAGDYSVTPWDWLRLLAPDLLGNDLNGTYFGTNNYHEQTSYLGIAPLLLLGIAFAWRRRSGRDRLLLAIAGGALLLAAGRWLPPFYAAYYLLPGFKLFRCPARYLIFFAFAAATLVGIVLTRMAAGERPPHPAELARRLRRLYRPAAVFFLLTAGLFAAWSGFDRLTDPGSHRTVAWAAARAALLLLGAGTITERWLQGRQAGRPTALALLGLTLLDFGLQWLPYRQSLPPEKALPAPSVVRALAEASPARILVHHYRRDGQPEIVPLLNWGEAANYDDLRGYNQGISSELVALLKKGDLGGLSSRHAADLSGTDAADWLLNLTGVRRIVAPTGEWPERWRSLPLVASGGGYEVRERSGYQPRAWLVATTETLTEKAALDRLPTLDLARVATVDRPVVLATVDMVRSETGEVRWLERSADRLVLDVHATRPALLVVADRFDPGWSATVDGSPQSIVRADYLLRGVGIPVGSHRIVFHYSIVGRELGRTITLITLPCVLLLGMGSFLRQRPRRLTTPNALL